MAGLRREVAMLALPVLTFVGVALAHLLKANAQTSTIIEALFVAVGTLIAAVAAVPRSMTAIGGTVLTLATLVSHYWWHLGPDEWAAVLVIVQTLFGMHVRGQATPVYGPAQAPQPVRTA